VRPRVGIGNGNAGFLHLSDPGKGNGGFHDIEAREADVSGRVLDHITVEISHESGRFDDRVDIRGAEQTIEAVVAARLIRQHVWPRVGRGRTPS
jgi:hypothetical protein